jgi:aminoglycoside phosphotransferase (APT) family kinase protein
MSMDSPWNTDRSLTLDDARIAITTRFPSVDARALVHLGSGWEFDAYLTSDAWVFRFPRRAWAADLFEPERRVHALVAPALAPRIAVPVVELFGEPSAAFPYPFAGHRFIHGSPSDSVDPGLTPIVARQIGAALGLIHSIPEADARAAGILPPDIDERGGQEWLARGREQAARLRGLDPTIDSAVAWLERISLPLAPYDGPARFIHQDVSPEHLLVDPRTGELTGILDWTDATLGDAARDFVSLVTSGGWDFAEEALRSYGPGPDRAFRKRLRVMSQLLSILWLGEAHARGADVPKHVAWVRNAFAPT